ncbi:ribonuclease type III Dicer [Toxoplasma gondii GAB2-2007-GAL-DOM2]|uniref:Ribonuclease type III Dicer n=2 Tax=Toxoplasma gondii TaxID=5811 RepID=A0A086KFB7_TOXGO|nr:ribonuclease type III Dicer [Toxoplasma gondii GAB2-2007-GAL-DOM2]KFG43085.1 ribonuclease type III Dicer [Toxoplasma gondii FOU]
MRRFRLQAYLVNFPFVSHKKSLLDLREQPVSEKAQADVIEALLGAVYLSNADSALFGAQPGKRSGGKETTGKTEDREATEKRGGTEENEREGERREKEREGRGRDVGENVSKKETEGRVDKRQAVHRRPREMRHRGLDKETTEEREEQAVVGSSSGCMAAAAFFDAYLLLPSAVNNAVLLFDEEVEREKGRREPGERDNKLKEREESEEDRLSHEGVALAPDGAGEQREVPDRQEKETLEHWKALLVDCLEEALRRRDRGVSVSDLGEESHKEENAFPCSAKDINRDAWMLLPDRLAKQTEDLRALARLPHMSETFLLLSRATNRQRTPHNGLSHDDEEAEEEEDETEEEEEDETEEEEDEIEEDESGVWREEPSRREVEASQRVWMSKIFSRYDTDGGRGDLDRVMAVDSVQLIYRGPRQSLLSSLQEGKKRANLETSGDRDHLRRCLLLLSETVRGCASNASVLRMWSSAGNATREERRAQKVGEKGRVEKKKKTERTQNEEEEQNEQSLHRKEGNAGGTSKAQTNRRTEGSLSCVSSTSFASSLSSSSSSLSSSSSSSPPASSSLSSFCGRREREFPLKGLLTAARNRDVILPGLPETYERLEFLGDALIGLLVTEWLFSRFPNFREGPLSEAKNVLLSNMFFARKLLRRSHTRFQTQRHTCTYTNIIVLT